MIQSDRSLFTLDRLELGVLPGEARRVMAEAKHGRKGRRGRAWGSASLNISRKN
jgi:hypothetical protein